MNFNIVDIINSIPDNVIQSLVDNHLWNYDTYKLCTGYNWLLSGRGGGKSTGIQSIAIRMFYLCSKTTLVLRANRTETTYNNMSSYFAGLQSIVFDDGKNLIQTLTDDKYNTVYYNRSKKSYILCCENDNIDDIKNNKPFLIMSSLDKSNELCSGFNLPDCNLIFCEEMIDDLIPYNALINLENIISTVFRTRIDTYVVLSGNLSRGNPRLLVDMKIYNDIKTTKVPYMSIKTKYNDRLHVELFDSLPEQNSQKAKFNNMYFCFDIEGEDVVRGSSNSIPLFRQFNNNFIKPQFFDTGLYIYTLEKYFKISTLYSANFQVMFYVSECEIVSEHDTQHVILTDDENFCYNTPYVYVNPLKKYPMSLEFIKSVRRKDVCYDNYLSCIAVTNLLDTFYIPDNI